MAPNSRASSSLSALHMSLVLGAVGMVAFGGPAAHVSLMRRELVERRHWVDAEDFKRMFAACNLVPGPGSTELAALLGYRLAGVPGLLLGGVFFVLPAATLMLGVAVIYAHLSATRQIHAVLYGVRPVAVAIIAWAAIDLARRVLDRRRFLLVVPPAIALFFFGINPVFILALAGLLGLAVFGWGETGIRKVIPAVWLMGPDHVDRLPALFFAFLKVGAVSFGSGYVLFAFLDADFVRGLGWLPPSTLVDAMAIGQVTPGPVFTTATFLGYLFAGIPGALLATMAIFLPGFALVPVLDRFVRMVDQHRGLRAFLDSVNAAVIGLIVVAGLELGHSAIVDPLTILLAMTAFPLILWRPLAAPAAVISGALVGLVTVVGH